MSFSSAISRLPVSWSRREYTRALTVRLARTLHIDVVITGPSRESGIPTARVDRGDEAGPLKCSRSAVPGDAPSGSSHASRPGLRCAQGRDLVDGSSMNAVVNASATAAGASRSPGPGRRGGGPRHRHPRREPPAHRRARARIQDVVALADAGRAERGLTHRQPAEDPRRLAGIAQRQRPAVAARRRLEGDGGAEAAVDEGALEAPLLEQLRHQVHRVALADTAEIDANAVGRRADHEGVGVDLERRQPGADGDVERAVGQVVDVPCDQEAFERGLADACALSDRQVIEAA